MAAPETLVDRIDRGSGGVDMSFWVWVGVAVVVVLVVAFVSDRRRRGGWFQGYSDADGRNRTDRQRADGDRTTGEGYGGPGI
jgi:hypothetical protein